MDKITIISLILGSLAALPFLMAFIKMRMVKAFNQKAVNTTATITHVEKKFGARSTYYWLTFEYKTTDTAQLFTARSVSSKKRKQGDTIPLFYLPGDPAKFSIDTGKVYPYMIAITFVFFLLILWVCYWLSHLEYTTH